MKSRNNNSLKILKQSLFRDIKPTIILALACIIWLCVAPSWYDWLEESKLGEWLTQCCSFLYECWFVYVPVCTLLGWLSIRWGCKIWKDEDIRTYRPFLIGLALSLLFRSQPLFATIFDDCDYRCFFVLLLSFPTIAIIKNSCGWICAESGKMDCLEVESDSRAEVIDKINGFTLDYDKQPNTSKSLDKYADAIVHRLLNTDLSEQAYAIGITSKWGSGKTTFLDMLREKLRDESEIVNFSPWNCRTPEQVIEDFFATLQTNLSTKHSSLIRPLRDYAKLVNSVSVSFPYGFSFALKPFSEERNISKKRDDLSKRFSLIQKPIVVFIDDLDRLEGNEVFEVLRLIRNTANLSNMIYIVAYDRDYVTNILDKKSICNSSDYVDKIFPVEIPMPKVEENQIWNVFHNDLNLQNIFDFDFAKDFISHFDDCDRQLILKVLDNYRSVKRFVRLYMLDVFYLYGVKAHPWEHKLLDMFWLELLQMYDKTLYDILVESPLNLLENDDKRYYLRERICPGLKYKKEVAKFDGPFPGKQHSPYILMRLFVPEDITQPLSISYLENYDKYFTLSVATQKFSVSDYLLLINCNDTVEDEVERWLNEGKKISSILYMLTKWELDSLSETQLKNYLTGVLLLCVKKTDEIEDVLGVRNMFLTSRFKDNQEILATAFAKDWFKKRIEQGVNLVGTSRLLNQLYGTERVFGHPDLESIKPSEIILDDVIEVLFTQTLESYFIKPNGLSAVSVFENSEFGKVFANCCVKSEVELYSTLEEDVDFYSHKQVAWDIVINYFSNLKQRPTIDEYYSAMESFLLSENPNSTTSKDEIISGEITNPFDIGHLLTRFGNEYKTKLKEFKNKCFDQNISTNNQSTKKN